MSRGKEVHHFVIGIVFLLTIILLSQAHSFTLSEKDLKLISKSLMSLRASYASVAISCGK